jgi:hypothetical protein
MDRGARGQAAGGVDGGESRDPGRLGTWYHAGNSVGALSPPHQHGPAGAEKRQLQRALYVQAGPSRVPQHGRLLGRCIRPAAAHAVSHAGECQRGEQSGERGAERVLQHQRLGKWSVGFRHPPVRASRLFVPMVLDYGQPSWLRGIRSPCTTVSYEEVITGA